MRVNCTDYTEEYTHLHEGLRSIWDKLEQGVLLHSGICYNALYKGDSLAKCNSTLSLLYSLMRKWPYHSGVSVFPVPPSPDDGPSASPYQAYCYSTKAERWSMSNYCGAMRLDLLVFLILEVEAYFISNNLPFTPIGGSNHG